MDKFLIQDVIDRLAPNHPNKDSYEKELRELNNKYDTGMSEYNGMRIQRGCNIPEPTLKRIA